MDIRRHRRTLLPVFLSLVAMAAPHAWAAQPSYRGNPEQTGNKQVLTSDAKAPQVVACLTLAPPDLESGYISIRDTEQHSDIIADTSKLTFILHTPRGQRTLFTYGTYDSLVSVTASRYSSMVFTGWEGGAHETARIFQIGKEGVRMVFEATSEQMPEVVWNGGVVLVSHGHLMKGNEIWPTESQIYVWDKDERQYKLSGTVPYGHRYDELAKLAHEVEKDK